MSPVDEFFLGEQLTKLAARWRNEFGNHEFRKRCFRKLLNLPKDAVEEIVDAMMDNFRYPPLPKDFDEAAIAWRHRFHQANGYTYGAVKPGDRIAPAPCSDCSETGFMFVKLSESHPETLMYCHCKTGGEKYEAGNPYVPRWEAGIYDKVNGFIKVRFPVQRFIPEPTEEEFNFTQLSTGKSVEWWKQTKRDAYAWWSEQSKRAKGGA